MSCDFFMVLYQTSYFCTATALETTHFLKKFISAFLRTVNCVKLQNVTKSVTDDVFHVMQGLHTEHLHLKCKIVIVLFYFYISSVCSRLKKYIFKTHSLMLFCI